MCSTWAIICVLAVFLFLLAFLYIYHLYLTHYRKTVHYSWWHLLLWFSTSKTKSAISLPFCDVNGKNFRNLSIGPLSRTQRIITVNWSMWFTSGVKSTDIENIFSVLQFFYYKTKNLFSHQMYKFSVNDFR